MLSESRLDELLARFKDFRVGLVGDLFLDRYLQLAPVEETSIETNLEAYQIDRVSNSPGALGTVMNNLAALGVGKLVPLTVIGDDGHGFDLRKSLTAMPVDDSFILTDNVRLTPTYTKPMRPLGDGSWQELNRLDVRTRGPLSPEASCRVVESLAALTIQVDAIVVLDQINETDWGVVNSIVREGLRSLVADNSDLLIYTDSRQHLQRFDFGILKGNHHELLRAAGLPDCEAPSPNSPSWLRVCDAAKKLSEKTNRDLFCTAGPHGILVASPDREPVHVPTRKVEGPIDIVGAGDSATAAIVLSLLAGASSEEAAEMANLTASITIQKLGTTGTASPAELRSRRAHLAEALS